MQITAIIAQGEAECDYLQLLHKAKLSVIIFVTSSYKFFLVIPYLTL